MSVWTNKFTYPGFVFWPHKPHPKGKNYHTISCDESGIIYGWENVEGRDHPIPMGIPEFDTSSNVKVVGIMFRLTRDLWSTRKAVIMDTGFCAFILILEMRGIGMFMEVN